jgi:hypothetical protein
LDLNLSLFILLLSLISSSYSKEGQLIKTAIGSTPLNKNKW